MRQFTTYSFTALVYFNSGKLKVGRVRIEADVVAYPSDNGSHLVISRCSKRGDFPPKFNELIGLTVARGQEKSEDFIRQGLHLIKGGAGADGYVLRSHYVSGSTYSKFTWWRNKALAKIAKIIDVFYDRHAGLYVVGWLATHWSIPLRGLSMRMKGVATLTSKVILHPVRSHIGAFTL